MSHVLYTESKLHSHVRTDGAVKYDVPFASLSCNCAASFSLKNTKLQVKINAGLLFILCVPWEHGSTRWIQNSLCMRRGRFTKCTKCFGKSYKKELINCGSERCCLVYMIIACQRIWLDEAHLTLVDKEFEFWSMFPSRTTVIIRSTHLEFKLYIILRTADYSCAAQSKSEDKPISTLTSIFRWLWQISSFYASISRPLKRSKQTWAYGNFLFINLETQMSAWTRLLTYYSAKGKGKGGKDCYRTRATWKIEN